MSINLLNCCQTFYTTNSSTNKYKIYISLLPYCIITCTYILHVSITTWANFIYHSHNGIKVTTFLLNDTTDNIDPQVKDYHKLSMRSSGSMLSEDLFDAVEDAVPPLFILTGLSDLEVNNKIL